MSTNCVENATRFFAALDNEFTQTSFAGQVTQPTQVLQVVLFAPNGTAVAWSISVGGGEASVAGPLNISRLQDTTVTARISIPHNVASSIMEGMLRPEHVIGHPQVILIGDVYQFTFLIPQALTAVHKSGLKLAKILGYPLQDEPPTEGKSQQSSVPGWVNGQTPDFFLDTLSTSMDPLSSSANRSQRASSGLEAPPHAAAGPMTTDLSGDPLHTSASGTQEDQKMPKLYTTPADSYRNAKKVSIDEAASTTEPGVALFSACVACRNSRVRCDYNGTGPCSRCVRLTLHCTPAPTLRRRRRKLPTNDAAAKRKPKERRRAACAACKRSKVKCGPNPTDPAGDCQRCTRMGIPCVKLMSTPGRPLARRTRELKIPSYAPPDLTTFPGIMVPSFAAAREHVRGAYPILALDELLERVRLAYDVRDTAGVRFNVLGGARAELKGLDELLRSATGLPDLGVQLRRLVHRGRVDAEQVDQEVAFSPRLLRWWCRTLLMLAVEERSRSEFKVCLQLATRMGMDVDQLVGGLPGPSFDALRNQPEVQIQRDENHSFKQPYLRPSMPKLAGFVEALANSADPAVASITMSIRNGRRTGTCNLRFAEMFLTNRTLDGFTMNGLAKPWYDLIVPQDVRAFFTNCMMQACLGARGEAEEDMRFSFANSSPTVLRDKNDRQWRGVLEFRMHLAEGGDVCDCSFGARQLQVLPKAEYISWPEDSEADAKGLAPRSLKVEPRTPDGWNERDEFYWKQGSSLREDGSRVPERLAAGLGRPALVPGLQVGYSVHPAERLAPGYVGYQQAKQVAYASLQRHAPGYMEAHAGYRLPDGARRQWAEEQRARDQQQLHQQQVANLQFPGEDGLEDLDSFLGHFTS